MGRYCTRTPTVSIPEFTQLDKEKSIMRYLPPKEIAGFALLFVSRPSLEPCPPARSIAIHSFFLTAFTPLSISSRQHPCGMLHQVLHQEHFYLHSHMLCIMLGTKCAGNVPAGRYMCHISSAYSRMVRSLEKNPEWAVFAMDIRIHRSLSFL